MDKITVEVIEKDLIEVILADVVQITGGDVQSVNDQTGEVILGASDVGAIESNSENLDALAKAATAVQQGELDAKASVARADTIAVPKPSTFTYIDPLNTLPSDYYGAGAAEIDVESVDRGGSLRLSLPQGGGLNGRLRDAFQGAQDWSNKNFSIWVRSTDWSQVNEIQLLLLSGGSYSDAVCFRLNIKQYLVSPPNNEWIQLIFNREQFTTVGAASWTDVRKIIYRGTATGSNTPDIYFDSFQVYDEPAKGVISINFDDGYESVMDAAGYMATKGLVGSLFVIPELLGTAGYLTQEDVDYLARLGWEISGHSPQNLATLSPEEVRQAAITMKKYLLEKGYRGADVYAYPEGVHNYDIRQIIGQYFSIGRDTLFISQPANYLDPLAIHSYAPTADTEIGLLTQRVADAATKGTFTVFCLHKIVETVTPGSPLDLSRADFETLIDAIVASGVDCLPMTKAIAKANNPTAAVAGEEYTEVQVPIIHPDVTGQSFTARRYSNGTVYLYGYAGNNSGAQIGPTQVIAQLPIGYRPISSLRVNVGGYNNGSANSIISINDSAMTGPDGSNTAPGTIMTRGNWGSTVLMSFNGISYIGE